MDSIDNRTKTMIIGGAVGFLVLLVIVAMVLQQLRSAPQQTETPSQTTNQNDAETGTGGSNPPSGQNAETGSGQNQRIAATVGAETIYTATVMQIADQLPGTPENTRKAALQSLIDQSVALQAAAKSNAVTLNESFFNNENLNLVQRAAQANRIQDTVEQRETTITGGVITLWFYNNGRAGSAGYEQGKQIALQKMTALQRDVASGTMTLEEAADAIRSDSSLRAVDPAYGVNAIFPFDNATTDQPITFDADFNKQIFALDEGETSPVVLLSYDDNGTEREAVYMFAQVTEKTGNGSVVSYESWLEQQKKNYEIKIN